MKRALGIAMIGCAIGLSGCSPSNSPSPKDVAQQYANDMSSDNFQAMSGLYVNSNSSDFKQFEKNQGTPEMTVIDDLFKHVKIVIGNEHINGNSATVDATVTSPNFGQIVAKITQSALSNAFSSGQTPSSNDMANELDNAINDPSIQTQTTKTEINLTKTTKGWKISNSNDGLTTAITGGANNLFSSFSSVNSAATNSSADNTPSNSAASVENTPSNTVITTNDASSSTNTNSTGNSANVKTPSQPQETTPLQTLVPLLTTWMNTQQEIRDEINTNLMYSNALPSDDYGTSVFSSDFYAVQSEYRTLLQLNHYLDADTSKIINFVTNHHFNKDQSTVVDFKARAAMVNEDDKSTAQQIQKMLAGEESLVQQFKNGSTNPSVPYWTFAQWNLIANDETTNAKQLMIDYARITTGAQ